jgi:hypothetical protein
MVRFDSTIGVTLNHIFDNFLFHSCPIEILPQVLIHLIGSWMDRESRAMGLIHYFTTELKVFWDY